MKMLFRLPTPKRIKATHDQMVMMDLIAMRNGLPLGEIEPCLRVTLRCLLEKELITCVTMGPAIYMLTPIGRMVRGRK